MATCQHDPADTPGHSVLFGIGTAALLAGIGVLARNATSASPSDLWHCVGTGLVVLGGLVLVLTLCHRFRRHLSWVQLIRLRSPLALASPTFAASATKAIAFPVTVSMAYEAGAVSVFCSIAIYALARTEESPTEVALLLPSGDEICRVEFDPDYQPQTVESGAWRVMKYTGTVTAANLEKLTRAVRHTRTRVTVEVSLLIPGGSAGAAHHESGVQFWAPETDDRGAPLAGPPRLTVTIDDWRLSETDHFRSANDLLSTGLTIANKIVSYGRATDPVSLAPKLVQADFVDEANAWSSKVQAFWVRSRESQ